jgi:hypothetical protein
MFFRGVALADFEQVFAAFVIRNVNGVELFFSNTELQNITLGGVARGELLQATCQVMMWLGPGDYFMSVVTRDGTSLEALDRRLDAFHFQVFAERPNFGAFVNLQPVFGLKRLGRVSDSP